MDTQRIEAAVRELLLAIGEDPEREGLQETPRRVAAMYTEVFSGLEEDPHAHVKIFHEDSPDEMVTVRDIPLYSMCEHHLLPFTGVAHIAYIPKDGRVIALSFLATSANTAPFIGLFGTVWGIMNTFHAIGAMKSASLATVAPGISEALIATAMGLLVAIPATIGYNTFHGSLGVLETRLVNFAGMFLNRVQRELNAHRAVSRSGQAE